MKSLFIIYTYKAGIKTQWPIVPFNTHMVFMYATRCTFVMLLQTIQYRAPLSQPFHIMSYNIVMVYDVCFMSKVERIEIMALTYKC